MIATLSRIRTRTGRIGLEFDGSGLRCAQVRRHGHGWRMVRSRAVTPEPRDSAGAEADSFAATDLLLAAAGFNGSEVASVLPMNHCDLRVLEVPRGTDEELRAMVAGEMESLDISDTVVDFWKLPSDSASRKELAGICALSASKPVIASTAKLIQAGGYTVSGIDSLPTACARAADMWRSTRPISFEPESSLVLSVHLGWDCCTLVMSSGGPPELARVPQVPGFSGWLGEVSRITGSDPTDLLRVVQGLHDGLLLRSTGRLVRRLEDITGNWCQQLCGEILRTLSFARRPGSRIVPSCVVVMGGGAMIPGLCPTMTNELNIETVPWDLPAETGSRGGAEFAIAAALSAWEVGS